MNQQPSSTELKAYLTESSRPLVALVFVTPMLLIYEAGVLLLGADATRNGAEVYLRNLLDSLGMGQYFLLPLMIAAILLGWHHATGQPWRLQSRVLWLMLAESAALGFLLLLFAQMQSTVFGEWATTTNVEGAEGASSGVTDRVVSYFGAGIYEELLFRLMLLPAVASVVRACGGSMKASLVTAVITTSLLFSAVHYRIFSFNQFADTFLWYTFLFRFLAGVFFAVLFVRRGFGIAAGAHALYDVLLVVFI